MLATDGAFRSKLEGLGTVDSIRVLAASGFAPATRPGVNAHIHLPPNFTAFETSEQAVGLAREQGVTILGASNYYDFDVYVDFASAAGEAGIFPLFGLEIISLINDLVQAGVRINDPGNPGKMYICGKGITKFAPLTDEGVTLLDVIRKNDSERMALITGRLADLFASAGAATSLNADVIKARIAARHLCAIGRVHLQERHLAQAFQERVFEILPEIAPRAELLNRVFGAAPKNADDGVSVQNDIRSYLMKAGKPAFVADTFVSFEHAYTLILALGGIPCYPTLADGVAPMTQYEASCDDLIADLKVRGIPAAEFIPNRNSPELLRLYVTKMRAAGLIVTAGTEHNTLDLLPLAPVCVGDAPIPEDVQEIFYEGACVLAAHEYLTLMGEAGYVDGNGTLNPAYESADARIRTFRAIGAAVLRRYVEAG